MTENEEREYLIDLLFESTRWKVDQDEVLNGLELEVRDRLRRLSGVNTVDQTGLCQSNPPDNLPAEDEALTNEDFKALEAARLNEHLASPEKVEKAWQKQWKWKMDKVRVKIDGKIVWKPKVECVQEPRDNRRGGPKWQWKWIGPATTTDKLSDELWQNHEAGND